MTLQVPVLTQRRLFVENGNFKSGTTLWGLSGATAIEIDDVKKRFRYGSLHVEPPEADLAGVIHDYETILPDTRYLVEVYLRGSGSWQVGPATYQSDNTFISLNSGGELVLNDDEWSVYAVNFTTTSVATKMRIYVAAYGAQAGIECWIGGALRKTGG